MTTFEALRELTSTAAHYVVDEGMEYGAAKRKAARSLEKRGLRMRELPSNDAVEDEVRSHIALFCADTQAGELKVLRTLALDWMRRLGEFRPHVGGAVWRGTATRLSDIHIDLYCDDPKSAEIALVNQGIEFDAGEGAQAGVDVLTMHARCLALQRMVAVHLAVHDLDDLRGALKPDARGRSWRGTAEGLRGLLESAP